MHRFSQFLITLPIVALPFLPLATKPALAETAGIKRALELLAKSAVVGNKCNVLTLSEWDELSTHVAKAEVAAVEKTSMAITHSTLESGRKEGQVISRGTEASIEVEETLVAALNTINAATEEEIVTPEPAVAVTTPVLRDSLSTYERITETYFLGRRYTYLSKRKMNAFYRAVLKNHQAVVSQFGKATVLKL